MKKAAFILPGFALIAGAVGCFLRKRELLLAFDGEGFPISGAAQSTALIVFSAVVLAILLAFAIFSTRQYKLLVGFENIFGTDLLSYPIALVSIGFVWFGATGMIAYEYFSSGNTAVFDLFYLILSALSAISIILFAILVYQDPRKKMIFALCMVPIIFTCFWLILLYRQNASNPFLLSYVYTFLAVMFSTLSFYYTAGFAYGKTTAGGTIFCNLTAVYFCFVTLADPIGFPAKVILAAILASNIIHTSNLLKYIQRKDVLPC